MGKIQRPAIFFKKTQISQLNIHGIFFKNALIYVGDFSTLLVARVERCKPIQNFIIM
jgi:hypothetical protein